MRKLIIALLALLFFNIEAHGQTIGGVTTVGGSWTLDIAPDINDDFAVLYATPFLTVGTSNAAYSNERQISPGAGLNAVDGGANGVYTLSFNALAYGTVTWGGGSAFTWTFDSGASEDPQLVFGVGSITVNSTPASSPPTFGIADEGDIRFYEEVASGTNYVSFKAPNTFASNRACVFQDTANPIPDSCVGNGTDNGDVTGPGSSVVGNVATFSGTTGKVIQDSGTALTALATTSSVTTAVASKTESLCLAISDESSAITTGTAKVTWRMPYAFVLTNVRASVNTVSTSGIPTIDINEGGTSIMTTNKLTIDANEKTSVTAATAVGITDANLASDGEMTADIDVAGTGTKGAKICLIGHQ